MRRFIGLGGWRLAAALVLTLGPTAVLAFFGYRTVAERERSLRLGYDASASIAKDRLAKTIGSLSDQVTPLVADWSSARDRTEVQAWIRSIAQGRAWMADPFVVRADGAITTAQLWSNWPRVSDSDSANPLVANAGIRQAERDEFVTRRPDLALQHYREVLTSASAPAFQAFALCRVGRMQVQLGQFDAALRSYEAAVHVPGEPLEGHGIPLAVLARMQIADIFAAMGRTDDAARTNEDLLRAVLDHPWNADDGYGYYLQQAMARAAPKVADSALSDRLDALGTIEWIRNSVTPLVRSGRATANPASRPDLVAVHRQGRTVTVMLEPITGDASGSSPATFAAVISAEYLAKVVVPQLTASVDPGLGTRVALVDGLAPTAAPVLSVLPAGDALPGFGIAIIDRRGRTLQQLTSRDRWFSGGLIALVLGVLVAGVAFMSRAWTREAELSQLRTDFVSNVSHELKTPLALIRLYGETLESGMVRDPTKQQEFFGVIRRETERLTHLINNVLDASRIEAGTKTFAMSEADIVALVREALEAYRALFARLGVTVDAVLPNTAVAIHMDRDAVAQALLNLFQNALRYGGDAGHVFVAVDRRAHEVAVSVEDRGPGIPSRELALIFDKFYRGAAAGSTTGTGLGLSIVKHVMTAHGGRVDVESIVGQGSTFTLVFPLEQGRA